MNAKEFEEIGHTGGTVSFHVVTGPDGRRGYQVGFHHERPVAASLFAVEQEELIERDNRPPVPCRCRQSMCARPNPRQPSVDFIGSRL